MPKRDDTTPPTPRRRPVGPKLVHMTWSHLLFLHWPINTNLLRKLVPDCLEADTHDGRAYVGLVPFCMSGLRPVGAPSVPGLSSFLQLNVRTYVKHKGSSGVFSFSIDASNPIAVWMARSFFHMPYFRAHMNTSIDVDRMRFTSSRNHQGARSAAFDCEWTPGKPLPYAHEGDLADFLTERNTMFTVHRGRVFENKVWHEPWALREARINKLETNLFEAAGLGPVQGEPIVHYCDQMAIEAWPQRESGTDDASTAWLDPALSPPPAS